MKQNIEGAIIKETGNKGGENLLEQKDLQAIAEVIDARITKTEEKVASL